MAYTQIQLDALEAAIAEGTLKVEYGDKKVEYRSLNEMIRIRDLMKAELDGLPKQKRTYGAFSKGTHPNDC
jgi:hypothetical protein